MLCGDLPLVCPRGSTQYIFIMLMLCTLALPMLALCASAVRSLAVRVRAVRFVLVVWCACAALAYIVRISFVTVADTTFSAPQRPPMPLHGVRSCSCTCICRTP